MALHCRADNVRARQVEFPSGLARSQSQEALAEARCARYAARQLGRVFAFPAAAGAGLLGSGVLLTRASTRSAASSSVNLAATCARSASRRASRSLSFVFSAVIWSTIVGAVVGILTLCDFMTGRPDNGDFQRCSCFARIMAPEVSLAVRERTALVESGRGDGVNTP
jgi:hypothetical protein